MKSIKRVACCLLFSSMILAGLGSNAQDSLAYEFKVPSINEWQLKPINSFPCLILKADEKATYKKNYDQLSAEERKIDKAVKFWITDASEADKQKATKEFIKYWKDYNKKWSVQNLLTDRPDGVAMRGIWRSIDLYDVVESFGYLSEADRVEFRDSLVKSIELALGKDAKHPKITTSIGFEHMNIWADVVVAAGTTALAFPELHKQKIGLNLR